MVELPTYPDPDVLIVGAGPTGAVAAKRFLEAGMRVVVLEQGDWPDYSQARADHPDFELTMGRYWSGNPNRRQARADYPIDDSESDISAVLFNAVGGGTVIYAAHWQRNMPSDFRVRALDGVADDWPLTYEDLAPFYERVEADFGVAGLAGDPRFRPGRVRPTAPHPLGAMRPTVCPAHTISSWAWRVARAERHPRRARTAPQALSANVPLHVGLCRRAKGCVDITALAATRERGAMLVTCARVSRLERMPSGLATARNTSTGNGLVPFQRARDHSAANASAPPPVAEFRDGKISEWARKFLRTRRQAAHAASLRHRGWPLR